MPIFLPKDAFTLKALSHQDGTVSEALVERVTTRGHAGGNNVKSGCFHAQLCLFQAISQST